MVFSEFPIKTVTCIIQTMNQDSLVGIATGYGRGSISGKAKIFLYSTASKPAQGPTQPAVQW
jgi:hypothetical protein